MMTLTISLNQTQLCLIDIHNVEYIQDGYYAYDVTVFDRKEGEVKKFQVTHRRDSGYYDLIKRVMNHLLDKKKDNDGPKRKNLRCSAGESTVRDNTTSVRE